MLIATKLLVPEFNNPLPIEEFQEVPTKRLVERLGLVRMLDNPAGFFDILPLGQLFIEALTRPLTKWADSCGFQHVQFSPVQPAELMKTSRRIQTFDRDIYRLEGHQSETLLSPTHEEYVLELLRGLGLRRAASLPITIYTIDRVLRRKNHRSTGGLSWTPMIPGFMTYSVSATGDQASRLARLFLTRFEMLLRSLNLGVTRVDRSDTFCELLTESPYGREILKTCDRGHASSIDENEESTCNECAGMVRKRRMLSLAMYFRMNPDISESLQYRVHGGGKQIHPILGTGGLGLSRTLMMTVEANRTYNGMNWPIAFAPIQVAVEAPPGSIASMNIANQLDQSGLRTLLDDRPRSDNREISLQYLGVRFRIRPEATSEQSEPTYSIIDMRGPYSHHGSTAREVPDQLRKIQDELATSTEGLQSGPNIS